MKQVIYHTGFFSSMFKYCQQKSIPILLLAVVTMITTGCFQQYYKTNTKQTADAGTIQQLKTANKYFIIHYTDKIMAAQNVTVANEVLEADLVTLPEEHAKYTSPNESGSSVMKAKYKTNTLMEVHLYTYTTFNPGQVHISLPVSAIKRMDVYEQDEKATRQNRVMSIVGVSAAAAVLVITIVLVANPPVSLSPF